jgi:hypothetical protein
MEECSVRILRQGIASLTFVAALACASAIPSFARPAHALSVTNYYTITDGAYTAYAPDHAVTPPKVSIFGLKTTTYVGVHFFYSGAKAKSTSFHVDFLKGATVVRRGAIHTLDNVNGEDVLDIPADLLTTAGRYKANLYINSVLAASTPFTMITTPTVGKTYMITGAQFDKFTGSQKTDPPKTSTFPANVDRVAVYFLYSAAGKKDQYWAIVYDKYGKQVHSSLKHPFQYLPSGSVALRLSADSGKYPAGAYRTDIYFDGAVIQVDNWATK